MLRTISSKVTANNLRKNQLSVTSAARAFASGPQANQFDKVKTQLGSHHFYKLPALGDSRLSTLPYSIRVLLESAVRNCDEYSVQGQDIENILAWEKNS
jgi:aconitate hydratase